MTFKLKPSLIALSAAICSTQAFAAQLQPIVVEADFRPTTVEDTSTSVTVIGVTDINQRSAQHVEKVLNTAPNVNFSAGASRGQYFQIRGIGERSQFQTPINPSVGLTIDGIDYSRTGAAATLLDTKQIEILRGPQGTRFGANALAGMILIEGNEPTAETEGYIEQTVGSRNTYTTTGVVSGSIIDDTLLGRLALQRHVTDGYMENDFLEKDNTNNLDELTGRAKLKWLASDDLAVDFTAMRIAKDNGYDAFTLDNDFTTESDTPGEDILNSTAFGMKATWDMNDKVRMEATASKSTSDIDYNYDADWVDLNRFSDLAAQPVCNDDDYDNDYKCPYNGAEQFLRKRNNQTVDIRLLSSENGRIFGNSTDWVVGLYQNVQNEKTVANWIDYDWNAIYPTESEFETRNRALYSQLDYHANDKLTYTFGVRGENYESDYTDSNDQENSVDETLFGGKLGFTYKYDPTQTVYASFSKSFKTGGINNDTDIPESLRNFETEYLWNLEAGLKSKWLNNDLRTRLALFYSKRVNPQVSGSYQVDVGDFAIYTNNINEGYNYGLEAEMDWDINAKWRMLASLGLLESGLNEYEYTDKYSGITYVIKDGRDQAHAPNYQYMIGAEHYINENWLVSANIEGKDAFYFSDSHNEKSAAYYLMNASAEYNHKNLTVTFWARNLLDRDYDVRGFYFGNDPSLNYAPTAYTQKGEPRTIGLTARYDF